MSYQTEFLLPSLGEGDGSARLINWLKQPGESFNKNDTLFEVETDKAVVEVPAPEGGVLIEQLAGIDDRVIIGNPVARVEYAGQESEAADRQTLDNASVEDPVIAEQQQTVVTVPHDTRNDSVLSAVQSHERVFATPFARKIARDRGIAISSILGTGKNRRIVGNDIKRAGVPGMRPSSSGSVASRERKVAVQGAEIFAKFWLAANERPGSMVVLLHGLFADSDAWVANASMLARNGIPVLALDLPCHGQTTLEVDSFEDIVQAVVDALALLVEGPITLIGHSFGAAVAARVARSPNLELNALGLIAPLGLGTRINQSFIDGMLGARTLDALRREIRKLTVTEQTMGEAYLAILKCRLTARSDSLAALCRSVSQEGVQQIDIFADLEEIGQAATIIHGRSDVIIPWEHVLAAPPRVALHLVPNAGHMPHWESSKLITDLLMDITAAK